MKNIFEIFGYSKDYYIGNKYMGSITLNEPDRQVFSYGGRQVAILEEDIVFKNKKRIKKGTEVMTELIPLCGKMVGR